jgi:hypothetical protein
LERGKVNSECRRGNVLRRNQMDVPERKWSPPAAASPDLAARDFLDADWTVHALRPGERELSQLAACGRRLTWGFAGRLVCADALRLGLPAFPGQA